MSQISLKSISGITSITTPTGVDNQLTLHTNNTNQAFKLDSAGNIHINNHLNTTGIVTATSFSGDGSALTGITQTTINNNADNRLLTGSGTANTLNAESDITYDGTQLVLASGKYVNSASPYRLASHPVLGYDSFTDISGGSYATRLGSTGTSTLRSTQIYGGGSHLATFDGVNSRLGLRTTTPAKDLHVYNPSVATVRIETGDSRGQAWDILSTNGAQNNTGTISIRDESGSSYIDFGANGGDPRLVAQLGGGSNLLYLDKHGNTTLAGICTANTFKGILVPTTYHGGRRNMFINGEFMINQRGTRDPMANQNNGANGLGYGGPDHVQFLTNLGAFDAKQGNENVAPRTQAGASYSYELDCTSASGPSTSNYTFLKFKWNGIEANRLLYGTSNARPVTISFWVQCNKTGNFTATLRNETANKLISSVVTISSSNTWEYKTITFVGDTAAQIAVTINARWSLELWLDGGSNYTGGTVRTGWTTKDNADRGAGSTLNICSSTSNYFRISLFQVEMGPYATPFEFRTYGEYLHDCEYYFQKPFSSRGSNQAFAIHIWGHKIADTYALRVQTMMRPTEMRINPTDYFHDNNPSGLTAQRYQTQGSDYEYTYNVGMSIGSNKKEFANGTKYPYGVNGMGSAESGILFAYDFESYAEY